MIRTEPWMAEEANAHLQKRLDELGYKAKVLEVGMGASTAFLFRRSSVLVSIEHDPHFYYAQLHLLNAFVCSDGILEMKQQVASYPRMLFSPRPYNHVIDELENDFFDIILIDGRDRVKCIRSAIPKLKSGGWLILDNSERPYYQSGIDLMKGWNRIDCKQEKPDKYGFTYPDWTTTIFIKP